MAQITIKFDNNLTQSSIILPLVTGGIADTGEHDEITGGNSSARQTLLYGTQVPLIKVGDIVLDYNQITYMELDGRKRLPQLTITFMDNGMIRGLQMPSSDSEVRLQILPRFENAYKKIDLTFYIKRCSDDEGEITLTCIYKVPELYNSKIECFGELSSYEAFEKVAQNCQLGFASNVADSTDKRYIYCANQSYIELMDKTIEDSGTGEIDSKVMYDWWVDFWNNINFVDIYERYNAVDPEEDMMVYVSAGMGPDVSQTSIDDQMFIRTPAVLSNDPIRMQTDLFVDKYEVSNNSKMATEGSDRVYTIYGMDERSAMDYFLQDGDQQKDVFTKYEYTGEYYGEYNYILASRCRKMMMDKIEGEIYEVTLTSPLISIMRGSKVNLKWYDTDGEVARHKQILGINDSDIETNIDVGYEETSESGTPGPHFRINKQVSGQYLVLSSVVTFENGGWSNTLRLARPRAQKQQYFDISEETKNMK